MNQKNKTKVYLFCGSGGVGKTTLSAAYGIKLALEGYKTIVLTIDPAKRLADSLGLKNLTDKPKKINLGDLKKGAGELCAMMLDTKRTFDRIVEKYSPNTETADKIFNNKIYQHMSQMLAGSQEYMAMERLYEIWSENKYDVIIIDTPPMQNAIDFLEAPNKMMHMIQDSMLHMLLKPTMSLGKSGFKLFERGSQQILKVFDRFTGFAFLQDISEMLVAFKELISGFEERAGQIQNLLQNQDSNFVAVCTAQPNSISETMDFEYKLKSFGYHLQKIIVNRVFVGEKFSKTHIEADYKSIMKKTSEEVADILVENYKNYLPLIKRDAKEVGKLSKKIGAKNISQVPLFLSDIHDLDGLNQLTGYL